MFKVNKLYVSLSLAVLVLLLLCTLSPVIYAAVKNARNPKLPTVTIVTTGGTIAEAKDPKTGAAIPTLSGDALIAAVPELAKVANINVVNFSNIDSSQMTPDIWAKLSKTVDNILKDGKIKGVVITHGTDSMSEGSFFLELTLKSKKPVVFVGSMRDASDLSADGAANILNAVTQVCSDRAKDWGVTVTLNQYICSARDVQKTQTTNVQTFNSGEKGYLGYICMGNVYRFNDVIRKQKFPLPDKLPNVVLITEYPGTDGKLVRFAVDSGAQGIVIEGVGAGNVNTNTYNAIEYALSKKIPVVITSRVSNGSVYPIYGDQGGGATMQKDGAILAYDLTPQKARILLMLALPQAKGNPEKLQRIFQY